MVKSEGCWLVARGQLTRKGRSTRPTSSGCPALHEVGEPDGVTVIDRHTAGCDAVFWSSSQCCAAFYGTFAQPGIASSARSLAVANSRQRELPV